MFVEILERNRKHVVVPKSLPNNAQKKSDALLGQNPTIEIGADRFKIPDVLFNPSLAQAVATSPIGGEFLTNSLLKSLEHKGISIKPRYAFKMKEIRAGEFQIMDMDFPNTMENYKLYSQAYEEEKQP